MEEIKQEWESFKKCTCRTFRDKCSDCMPQEEIADWWLKKLNLAVSKERERIVDRIKEQAELYNGVSEYFCPDCKIRIGRWSGKVLKDGEVETRFGYIKSQN